MQRISKSWVVSSFSVHQFSFPECRLFVYYFPFLTDQHLYNDYNHQHHHNQQSWNPFIICTAPECLSVCHHQCINIYAFSTSSLAKLTSLGPMSFSCSTVNVAAVAFIATCFSFLSAICYCLLLINWLIDWLIVFVIFYLFKVLPLSIYISFDRMILLLLLFLARFNSNGSSHTAALHMQT